MELQIKRPLAKRVHILASFAAIFALVMQPMAGFVATQVANASGYVFNSTNELNKQRQTPNQVGKAAPFVELIESRGGEVELQFNNPLSYRACFEYRIDGERQGNHLTPEVQRQFELNGVPLTHNVIMGDTIYPQVCLGGNTTMGHTLAHTFAADSTVEVRLALGPERDWDFNWVQFDAIDDTAPVVTVTPAMGNNLRGLVTFNITVTDNKDLDPTKNTRVWVDLFNTAPPQATKGGLVNLSNGSGSITIDTKLIADGTANFRVDSVYDAAGNSSGTTTVRSYTVDNTGPIVTQLHPANNALVGKSLDLRFEVVDPSGIRQVNIHLFQGGATKKIVPLVHEGGNIWKAENVDVSDLSGEYTFVSRAVDNLGNLRTGTGSTHGKVTIDSSAPTVSITNPASGWYNTDVAVRGTVTDDNLSHYWVKVTHNGTTVRDTTVPSTGITDAILYNATAEGTYVVTLAARDNADNRSSDVVRTFTIDITAPVITTNIANDAFLSGSANVELNTIDEAHPSIVNIRLTDASGNIIEDIDGNNVGFYKGSGSTNAEVWTFDTTKVANGTYRLQFSARDKANNPAEGIFRTITVDNDAPLVELWHEENDGTVEVWASITDDNLSHYYLSVTRNGERISPTIPGTFTQVTTDEFSNRLLLTLTEAGEYTVKLEARDLANNKSNTDSVKTITFTIATSDQEEATPAPLTIGGDDIRSIYGTAQPGAQLFLTINGSLQGFNFSAENDGRWVHTFNPELTAGLTHEIEVCVVGSNECVTRYITTPRITEDGDTDEDDINDEEEAEESSPAMFAFGPNPAFPAPSTGDTVVAADDSDADVLGDSANTETGSVLSSEDARDTWSLANLLLTVVVWVTTLMALAGLLNKDRKERKTAFRVLTVVPAVGAAAILFFVENFSGVMGWVNIWTVPLIALAIVQVILLTKARSQAE